jgi:transcriptional regulator with XRE-family HTH domain
MTPTVDFPDGPQGFPARVRTCRLLLGRLSLRELGSRANLSRTAIRDLERGATEKPSIEAVFALAAVIGCSAAWLWKGEGAPPALLDGTGFDLAYNAGYAAGRIDADETPPSSLVEPRAQGWWIIGRERAIAERPAQPTGGV